MAFLPDLAGPQERLYARGVQRQTSLFLFTSLGLGLVSCGPPPSEPQTPTESSATQSDSSDYGSSRSSRDVPYDFDAPPSPVPEGAAYAGRWWEATSACPEGASLFGGVPPEFDRVGCKTQFGKNEGPHTRFYPSGKKREEGRFASHFAEGIWVEWDEEGRRLRVTPYEGGKQEGVETIFYPNGVIKSQRTYQAGRRHGLVTIWDEREHKRTMLTYENGKQHGPEARWDIEGYLGRVIDWESGRKVGER